MSAHNYLRQQMQLATALVIVLICIALLGATRCSHLTTSANQVVARGDRILSIAVTAAADGNFDRAFSKARTAGMQATSLAQNWSDLEPSPLYYEPTPNFLKIANLFYPAQSIQIALEINPIDIVNRRIPSDLAKRPFDDPEVISRFNRLLDWVFSQIPDLKLTSLTIGNEIDSYLADDQQAWRAYQTFFEAVVAHVHQAHPNLQIGAKATLDGLLKQSRDSLQALNAVSDVIMATYYPLDLNYRAKSLGVVSQDLRALTNAYSNREIYLLEVGYPSSQACGSSEATQASFIHRMFEAWDEHQAQIKLITFTWLTDLTSAEVSQISESLSLSNPCFIAYLETLGLRTSLDQDKAAFKRLKQEANRRGW